MRGGAKRFAEGDAARRLVHLDENRKRPLRGGSFTSGRMLA